MIPPLSETPFSPFWYWSNVTTFSIVFLVLLISINLSKNWQKGLTYFFVIFFISFQILSYIRIFSRGNWTLATVLPLNMCDFTFMAAIIFLLTKNQLAFEITCFWGIPGGILSFWTPRFLLRGYDFFIVLNYFTAHAATFFAVFWGFLIFKIRPREKIAFKIFLWSHLLIPTMGSLNYLMGTNFMYINKAPPIENPFVTGDFPYSVIGLELGTIFFMTSMSLVFYFEKQLHHFFIRENEATPSSSSLS